MAGTAITATEVRAAIAGVPDPEMPAVSVTDLGMIVDVRVLEAPHGARVEVDLVATFSGCPAIDVIRQDVTRAVRDLDGVSAVEVRFVTYVTWTPERISERAHEALRAFGIAPPGSGAGGPADGAGAVVPVGARTLPVAAEAAVTCPLCGSRDTAADSPFGPTPCRSTHYCRACRNPFEAIKD